MHAYIVYFPGLEVSPSQAYVVALHGERMPDADNFCMDKLISPPTRGKTYIEIRPGPPTTDRV